MTFNQVALGFDLLDVPDDFAHWFAGFVDGEGSFNIRIPKKSNSVFCKLVVRLRDDDINILHKIKNTLKVGTVRKESLQSSRNKGVNAADQAAWAMECISDARWVIVPFFEKYPLRTKKRNDFEIWKQAVAIVHCKVHLTKSGREQIIELKAQLENGRKYRLETV